MKRPFGFFSPHEHNGRGVKKVLFRLPAKLESGKLFLKESFKMKFLFAIFRRQLIIEKPYFRVPCSFFQKGREPDIPKNVQPEMMSCMQRKPQNVFSKESGPNPGTRF